MTSRAADRELADVAESVHWSIFRITAELRRREYATVGHGDLSLTQCSILYRLRDRGPTRISDLAAIEGVTKATMTIAVGRLESIGMVRRRADSRDGRVVWIEPTERGLAAQRTAVAGTLEAMLAALTPADLTALAAAVVPLRTLAILSEGGRFSGATR